MATRFDADGEDYTRSLSFAVGTITVTCWVNIDVDRNAFSTAWDFDNGAGITWLLQTDTDGVEWELFDSTTGISNIFIATVGTWYFIAISKTTGASGTTAYWADAATAVLNSVASTHAESGTVTTLRVGESVATGEWFNGRIAALKIWTGVALTQAEIENERGQYLPRRTANLFGFYPFLEGGAVAGAQQDFSGNGNTLSGGTGSATADGPPIPWRQTLRRLVAILGADPFMAKGEAVLDFGAFPGKSDASVTVTGQTNIVADSQVEAWIRLEASSDHSADEHLVDPPMISAGAIVAGTGFTIYGVARDGVSVPNALLRNVTDRGFQTIIPNQEYGRTAPMPYGQWIVSWAWA